MTAAVAVRKTYVDGPFGQVHCRIARPANVKRPPVVCLHMSPKSGKSFEELLPLLARDRVALAPDYPGHGESDLPPAEPHVSIADFAASTWAVVDALAEVPAQFVGYHTGAMVAVEAATQRPADVVGIVSVSAPVFDDAELPALQQEFSPIPIDEQGSRFAIMWQRVLRHRGPGMTLPMAAASFAENLRAGDAYEWGHRAAFAYAAEYRRKLSRVEHPVFVMNPADDCFEQSKRADALLQNGRRVDFPQWGHGFMNAYPRDVAAQILAFFDDIESVPAERARR